jgi:hypothetical protein
MIIVFFGLPGSGKTYLGKSLYLRVDPGETADLNPAAFYHHILQPFMRGFAKPLTVGNDID